MNIYINPESRAAKVIVEIANFCNANPSMRFWQALAAMTRRYIFTLSLSKYSSPKTIDTIRELDLKDTFYLEGIE